MRCWRWPSDRAAVYKIQRKRAVGGEMGKQLEWTVFYLFCFLTVTNIYCISIISYIHPMNHPFHLLKLLLVLPSPAVWALCSHKRFMFLMLRLFQHHRQHLFTFHGQQSKEIYFHLTLQTNYSLHWTDHGNGNKCPPSKPETHCLKVHTHTHKRHCLPHKHNWRQHRLYASMHFFIWKARVVTHRARAD